MPEEPSDLKPKTTISLIANEKGSALLTVIVTVVLVSLLSAGLISVTGTSVFNQTGLNSTSNAFYMAEGGLRYAVSNIADISTFHNQTFTLSDGNSFTLTVESWDFDITGTAGTQIQTEIPYGEVPFSSTSTPGEIAVGAVLHTYSSIFVSGTSVNFTISSGGTLPVSGKVQPAALKDGTSTITEHSTISFKGTNPLNIFPEKDGYVTIGANTFRYASRTATQLVGITAADGTWPGDFVFNDDEPAILDSSIEIHSSGSYGTAMLSSQRLKTHYVSLSSGSGESTPTDYFEDKDDWSPNTGTGSTGEGEFETGEVDGGAALIVTDTTDVVGLLDTATIDYDWENTDLDLDEIWSDNAYLLSYNVQVKIMITNPDPSTYDPYYQNMPDNYFYMAGINFRKRDNGDSYGLSVFRAETDNQDGIPDLFNPFGGGTGNGARAMIVLWERVGSYGSGWRWLAYADLSGVNLMREPQVIFEDDFESGLSNWTAGVPDTFSTETITSHDGTPTTVLSDSPGGNYSSNSEYEITSNAIDTTGLITLSLSFWHRYNTERWRDICRVQVQADGGSWQTIESYYGSQSSWEEVTLALDDILPANSVRIRFVLDTSRRTNRDGWYIDDVSLETHVPKWFTLMLHLEEKEISGTKLNEIKAYISDETVRGTPNSVAQDNNRLNNPRNTVNWPPYNVADTTSSNDYFTLIQWDGINSGVTLTGTGDENDAIVRTDTLTSPGGGVFIHPEIGLHAWGWNYNITYFDDFSVEEAP